MGIKRVPKKEKSSTRTNSRSGRKVTKTKTKTAGGKVYKTKTKTGYSGLIKKKEVERKGTARTASKTKRPTLRARARVARRG